MDDQEAHFVVKPLFTEEEQQEVQHHQELEKNKQWGVVDQHFGCFRPHCFFYEGSRGQPHRVNRQ